MRKKFQTSPAAGGASGGFEVWTLELQAPGSGCLAVDAPLKLHVPPGQQHRKTRRQLTLRLSIRLSREDGS